MNVRTDHVRRHATVKSSDKFELSLNDIAVFETAFMKALSGKDLGSYWPKDQYKGLIQALLTEDEAQQQREKRCDKEPTPFSILNGERSEMSHRSILDMLPRTLVDLEKRGNKFFAQALKHNQQTLESLCHDDRGMDSVTQQDVEKYTAAKNHNDLELGILKDAFDAGIAEVKNRRAIGRT